MTVTFHYYVDFSHGCKIRFVQIIPQTIVAALEPTLRDVLFDTTPLLFTTVRVVSRIINLMCFLVQIQVDKKKNRVKPLLEQRFTYVPLPSSQWEHTIMIEKYNKSFVQRTCLYLIDLIRKKKNENNKVVTVCWLVEIDSTRAQKRHYYEHVE